MLTPQEIRAYTNHQSYQRGVDLFYRGKIKTFYYNRDDYYGMDDIQARVKGSGYNNYDVSIRYDYENEDLIECDCECPAFFKYPGICKHIVAVLMEYSDRVRDDFTNKRNAYAIDYGALMGKKPSAKPKPQLKPVKRRTSPEISVLIKNEDDYRFLPLFAEKAEGKVKLEPIFNVAGYPLQVEFKIGIDRMYVLKDISGFIERVNRGAYHAYGKQLKFHHKMNAFDAESQLMIKYLAGYFEEARRYYYSQAEKRYLDLEVDGFVALIKSADIHELYTLEGYYGEPKTSKITYDKLPRNMKIEKATEGLELSIEHLNGYRGVHHYVYFVGDRIYIVDVKDIASIQDFLAYMASLSERKAFIAKEDVQNFARQLLPALREHYTIDMTDVNLDDYKVDQAAFSMYLDLPEKDLVTCRVKVAYGDKEMYLFEDVHSNIRDSVLERRINKGISAYFSGYDSKSHELYLKGDEHRLYQLLTEGLPELASYGEIFVSDKLKKINVVKHGPVQVGVKVDSGLLDLTLKSKDLSSEQLAEILMQYNPKRKYYRLKNGDFIDVKDSDLEGLHELTEGLNLTEKQIGSGEISLPKYRALFIDEQIKKNSGGADRDKDFKALIRDMKTVEENDFELPEELDTVLRSYQKTGFLWMKTLMANGFGGILADDMGLGKTLQVITFLKSEFADSGKAKALIVCPSSLVYNWRNEFEKFAPDMKVITVTGSPAEREVLIESSCPGDILITSYDLLKRDDHLYQGQTFKYQVIDEAQYIKNSNTKAAKAVKAVQAEFKLALTGTPIENRLSELWSIFDFLMPGFLYTYKKFRTDIETAMVQHQNKQVAERLRKMVTPFILRRLKKDVLSDLPDKIEENIIMPMVGEQRKVYDARASRLKEQLEGQSSDEFRISKIKILAELTRLRQLCCDPALVYENYEAGSAKVAMCMDLVQEAVDGNHKVLLFSQFTSVFERLQKQLSERQISHFSLTGSTSKEERIRLVDLFNHDDTSVFCISLKAGGTGLNLTAADIVIHFDPWWNVAAQNQATDRVHRIGQNSVVNVYQLIAKDSIEEKILKMQERKQALADEVLSGEGIGGASFSKEELLEILG